MLVGKQDQIPTKLTDGLLFGILCAWRCLHLAAPCSAPPARPGSALWSVTENKNAYSF